ncbi:hypothetical protein [uncultured Cloacibacillus sp.]|uniref:hypothetical protein n=1 Tax=uncultured Cloacibacillus sp. TaxID=889794 RepID=UPI0026DB007F|nr:hypothetical protein [uncultured Cloacibacillus sp.]
MKARKSYVEGLIHTTKYNAAAYPEFDKKFYKFPSYYRRSAIAFVLGALTSYHTRLEQYKTERYNAVSNGKKFRQKPPTLNIEACAWPVMYKKEMLEMDGKRVYIKAFIRNTWDWIRVACPNRDLKDLIEKSKTGAAQCPTLVYKYHKFNLIFPIEYEYVKFLKTPLSRQIVLAVDLGVNRGAVASLMDSSGTILKRFYDPFTRERDLMDHLINRIRKLQRSTGQNSLAKIYTKLAGVKENYVKQLSRWIADIAVSYNAYGIVFEHFGKSGKNKSARIHHWCRKRIQQYTRGIALRAGIRTFLINPCNTSRLAFDGSGVVTRDKENYSMCTFASGKRYDCDLNASYNIGARYFIRELEKSTPETEWSQLKAKVPELARRTGRTLSTLWALQECGKIAA